MKMVDPYESAIEFLLINPVRVFIEQLIPLYLKIIYHLSYKIRTELPMIDVFVREPKINDKEAFIAAMQRSQSLEARLEQFPPPMFTLFKVMAQTCT